MQLLHYRRNQDAVPSVQYNIRGYRNGPQYFNDVIIPKKQDWDCVIRTTVHTRNFQMRSFCTCAFCMPLADCNKSAYRN
jgi:hypothetical protein